MAMINTFKSWAFLLCLLCMISSSNAFHSYSPLYISNKNFYGEETKSCSEALTDTLLTIDDLVNIYLILSTGKYLDNWGAYG
jgi:hypothetical protein